LKLSFFGKILLVLGNIILVNISETRILSLFSHNKFSECSGTWSYRVKGYLLWLFKLVLCVRVNILPEISRNYSVYYHILCIIDFRAIEQFFNQWFEAISIDFHDFFTLCQLQIDVQRLV
jgi:hypothetical protein